MTAVAKVEASGMTEQQGKLVQLLIDNVPMTEAWKAAGYSNVGNARIALAGAACQRALKAAGDGMLPSLRLKALRTVEELMDSGPAQQRLGAAKLAVELTEDAQGDDRPLTAYSIEELEALVRQKEAQLRDVTPSNGAHP